MKKNTHTLASKLKSYSASAASLLATAAAANAQVVYTDINPDVTLNTDSAKYELDLNNDHLVDFTFFMYLNDPGVGARVIPSSSTAAHLYNAIGGSLKKNAFSGNNGYPYAFSMSEKIDSAVKFFDLRDLSFVYNNKTYTFAPFIAFTLGGTQYGNWFGLTDKYMPLRISTKDGNFYGWVRCDVNATGTSITLKDYAYNSTAGEPLFAGQGNPTGIHNVNGMNVKVYAFDGALNVMMGNEKINDASLQITNMLGQLMKTVELTRSTTRLNVADLSSGVYVVTIHNAGKTFTTKVALQN